MPHNLFYVVNLKQFGFFWNKYERKICENGRYYGWNVICIKDFKNIQIFLYYFSDPAYLAAQIHPASLQNLHASALTGSASSSGASAISAAHAAAAIAAAASAASAPS